MIKFLQPAAKCSLAILLLPMLALSCKKDSTVNQQAAATGTTAPTTNTTITTGTTAAGTYKLIWADEFDSTAVDLHKWTFETGNLGVNNEKEYYQAANAAVSNGNLVITAKQQTVNGFPYTSARMNTSGKFSVQYGRVEARIKMPLGAGLWPAFWMLGSDINTVGWPKCGEIDIMEHVNADSTIHGTIHWDNNGHQQSTHAISGMPGGYHVYAIEWDSQGIRWYIDNTLFASDTTANNINSTEEFNNGPFFILLNLAVAGDFPGQTVDLGKLPASMYVDYVRVYKAQ